MLPKKPGLTQLWSAIGLLMLSSLACNALDPSTEPALVLPPPPTAIAENTATANPVPCQGCDIAATATVTLGQEDESETEPGGDATIVMQVDLNVRAGPGVHYDRLSFMLKDESTRILGKDPDSGWWKIECPPRSSAGECWVSGGTQFTTAYNVQGVPIAAIPPTPTPVPPTPAAIAGTPQIGGGLLVYGGDSGLWAVSLDLEQNPPAPAVPWLLSERRHLSNVSISPDGEKIAYVTGASNANALHIIDLVQSNDRLLLNSTELPLLLEENRAALVAQTQWLANSDGIAFNTRIADFATSREFAREDLWTMMLDGTLTERLGAGQGGGVFSLSSGNRLIMSQAEGLARANLDGSDREMLFSFELVNTGSEYVYYPQPQWIDGGSAALVAIPSREQFEPEASAQIWRIPERGAAALLSSIPGNTLFNSVKWSADGQFLAYVQQSVNGTNLPRTLALASGDGQGLTAYATGDIGPFVAWSPTGESFLYTDNGFFVVGKPGESATVTKIPAGNGGAQWLNSGVFIAPEIVGAKWQINIADVSGARRELTTANSEYLEFDLWIP
jgi:Tol biopolymer transport system component